MSSHIRKPSWFDGLLIRVGAWEAKDQDGVGMRETLCLSSHGDLQGVRERVHSRFRNSIFYFPYILVDLSKTGMDSILEYCCQCKNGQKTVRCCAHVITVLRYLGFARYQAEIPRPANRLNDFFADLDPSDEDTNSEWFYLVFVCFCFSFHQ